MRGILNPLVGKTITCTGWFGAKAYAYVDALGDPYTRVVSGTGICDSGWVAGFSAQISLVCASSAGGLGQWSIAASPNLTLKQDKYNGGQMDTVMCTANWPAT